MICRYTGWLRLLVVMCVLALASTGHTVTGQARSDAPHQSSALITDSHGLEAAQGSVTAISALSRVTPAGQAAHLAVLTEMRHWSNPDYTRVSVSLDREVRYEVHQLRPPAEHQQQRRLYIDLLGTRLQKGVRDIPIGDGLLKVARVGQYRPTVVRVVLDIENIKDYKVFALANPFRIIVDVKGERRLELSSQVESIQAATPSAASRPQEQQENRKLPVKRQRPGTVRRVVIDPGHGGHDPGAIGPAGTKEKDVVLEMGLMLARRLKEELDLDVVMTRSTDVFIPLEERTAIANKVNADLFVSVHANASLNRATSGVETYYLNLAKSEKAAQLAARENNTSLEKVSLLQAVLFDLMANYKITDSAHLAEEVQNALMKRVTVAYPGVKNHGVKQGPFYVLVGASMPSILVETAFISNEQEESRLKDTEYQRQTVQGIVDGIQAYIAGGKSRQ